MAGHNKWSKIKRSKGKNDAQRGRLFTRLAREITQTAREGGGDPDYNAALRSAIDRAKAENLPANNIERAIQKGIGGGDGVVLEEVIYEGYGPHKVAVLVRCLTDNRTRTVADLRATFRKAGTALGESGSVSWMFDHRGLFVFEAPFDEEVVMDAAIEVGAEEIETNEDGELEVICPVEAFAAVRKALDEAGLTPTRGDLVYLPNTVVEIGEEEMDKVMSFIDAIEEVDDVQDVTPNFDVTALQAAG